MSRRKKDVVSLDERTIVIEVVGDTYNLSVKAEVVAEDGVLDPSEMNTLARDVAEKIAAALPGLPYQHIGFINMDVNVIGG